MFSLSKKLTPRLGLVEAEAKCFENLVWTARWLRESEADAAASQGLNLSQLMVRAGTAAHMVCQREYPNTRHCLILVGPGNNGGDGYVMARLFKNTSVKVTIWAVPHSKPLPVEASAAKQAWEAVDGTCEEMKEDAAIPDDVDLIVDGLLGTGISGAPRGLYASIIERVNRAPVPRVAIDIPSGLNAETGEAPGACFRADHTVTFITLKPGLLTGRAREYVGRLHYSTLGLQEWLAQAERQRAVFMRRLHGGSLPQYFGTPRPQCSHKGSNGRVTVIGGDAGMGGAAVMAGEAAVACGAGLTSVVTRAAHVGAILTRCPEIMVSGVDTPEDAAAVVGERLRWSSAVAVGPGMAGGPLQGAVAQVLAYAQEHREADVVYVLDAGALDPALLAAGGGRLRLPQSIITPHPGEAARLLSCTVAEVEADRVGAVRRLADLLGGVAVLKGAGTLICAAGSDAYAVVDAGNPGMGAGGMGDTLTGILVGLAGQRRSIAALSSVFEIACAGCLVHAVAADMVAASRGTRGVRPSELAEIIPWCINGAELQPIERASL